MATIMSGSGASGRNIAVQHARDMHGRGRLSSDELDLVHKLADHEHLSEMDMDDYAELRNGKGFDKVQKGVRFDDGQIEKAEEAVKHVLQDFTITNWHKGHLDDKTAVKMLSSILDLEEGDSDSDKLTAHALESAEPGYRPPAKAVPAPETAPVQKISASDVEEYKARNKGRATPGRPKLLGGARAADG